jgi:WD40 repeat protein
MRFLAVFANTAALVFGLSDGARLHAQTPAPHKELKIYALPENTNSADISPSEELVVTARAKRNDLALSPDKPSASVIQLWKFKEQKLIAEFPDVGYRIPIVRFAPDGSNILALLGQTIHVLRVPDLVHILSFPITYPAEMERTSRLGPTERPFIRQIELSPNGDRVAIFWMSQSLSDGQIQIYDLPSGIERGHWDTPDSYIYFTKGFVWNPDGKSILIAIPNESPCMSPGSRPDVFVFDAGTGNVIKTFTSGLLTGSVAVSADQHAFAVDLNCLGVFKNHDPQLKVFDLKTGKHLRNVSGPAGVRYRVSASADGMRLLAFTGKMKVMFDWSDAVPYDKIVDEKFTVWNLRTYEEIATSQNIPGLKDSDIRLSAKGNYAVSYGKTSFVYQLP